MAFFDALLAEYSAKRSVRVALLVFFDFGGNPADGNGPKRVWPGPGNVTAGGFEWQGLGTLGSIEGLEHALGMTAGKATFSLSGVDASIVTLARNQSSLVKGRTVVVYLQFFGENLQPVGNPRAIWVGTLDQMRYMANGRTGLHQVKVTAEGPWATDRGPRNAYYTDRDQKGRFPGDRGLEKVAGLGSKTLLWPNYPS